MSLADEDITPVLFRIKRGKKYAGDGVTAAFPCEPADVYGHTMACYAHVGQHGACDLGWYHTTRPAKPEEYASLRAELEGAPYRYRLKVYRKIHPFMRAALRKASDALVHRIDELTG